MKMKNYLRPNAMKITKEEMQLIFKLRSRMTDTKMNYQGLYDDFECGACGKEDEDQKHIFECTILMNMNNVKEIPAYEKLFNGKVDEQLQIARIFKQNMTNKEELLKKIES